MGELFGNSVCLVYNATKFIITIISFPSCVLKEQQSLIADKTRVGIQMILIRYMFCSDPWHDDNPP